MSAISNEDREAVRDGLSRLLTAEAGEEKLRREFDGESGYPTGVWLQMAEMGLLGIAVAEEAGGIGGGAIDVAMVMEELGGRLLPVPYLTSSVIAANLLQSSSNDWAASLLANIIAGEALVAIGGTGGAVPLQDAKHTLIQTDAGDHTGLSGSVSLVLNGSSASHFLLCVETAGQQNILLVEAKEALIKRQPANDPALRPTQLTFNNAKAQKLEGIAPADIENVRLRAVSALAAEQAGAARAIFDITIEYLKTRFQFGRPIGSFQALKHMAADLLVEVESATSASLAAANAIDAESDSVERSVALAGFTCADAFREVSAQAIQMHGGIAYTQEHVAHLYWRRARAMLAMFENSNQHRERFLKSWEDVA